MPKFFQYNATPGAAAASWALSLVDPECIQINGILKGVITAHKMERVVTANDANSSLTASGAVDPTLHYALKVEIISGSNSTILDLFDGSGDSRQRLIGKTWLGNDSIDAADSIFFEHPLDMSESQSIVKICRTTYKKANTSGTFGAESVFEGHSVFNYVVVHEIPPQKLVARNLLINDGDGGSKLRFNIADAPGLLNVSVYVSEKGAITSDNKELSVDVTHSATGVPTVALPFVLIDPSANTPVLPISSEFRKNDFQWDVDISTSFNLSNSNSLTLNESKFYTFSFVATNEYGVSDTLVIGPISTDLRPTVSSNFNFECVAIPQVLNAAGEVVVSEDLELHLSYSYPDGVFLDNHCESMITFYRGHNNNTKVYEIHGTYQLPSPKSLLDAVAAAQKNLDDANAELADEPFQASPAYKNKLDAVNAARDDLVDAQKMLSKFSINGNNVRWTINSADLLGNGLQSSKGGASVSSNTLTMVASLTDTSFLVTPLNLNDIFTALSGRSLLVAHKSLNYYRSVTNKVSEDSNKVPFVFGAFANQLVVDVDHPMEVRIGEIKNAYAGDNGYIYYSGAIKHFGGISKGKYNVNASLMDSNTNNTSNRLTVAGLWDTMNSAMLNESSMSGGGSNPRFRAIYNGIEQEVIQPGQLVWHIDFTPNLVPGDYTGDFLEKPLLQNARLAYTNLHKRNMLAPVGSVIRTPVAPTFNSVAVYEKLLVIKMNAISTHNIDSIEYSLVDNTLTPVDVSTTYFPGRATKYIDDNTDKVFSRDVNIVLDVALPSDQMFRVRAKAIPDGNNMDDSDYVYSQPFSIASNDSKKYLLPSLELTTGANNNPALRNNLNVTVSVPLHDIDSHVLNRLKFRSIAEDGRVLSELLTRQSGEFVFSFLPNNSTTNDPKPYKYNISVPLSGTALWSIDCVLEGTYTTNGGVSNTYSMNSNVVNWSTVGTPEIRNVRLFNRVVNSTTTNGKIVFDVVMNGTSVNDFINLSGSDKALISAVPGDDATSSNPLATAEIIVFASLVSTSDPNVYTVTASFNSSIVLSSNGEENSYLILMLANGKPVSVRSGIYASN